MCYFIFWTLYYTYLFAFIVHCVCTFDKKKTKKISSLGSAVMYDVDKNHWKTSIFELIFLLGFSHNNFFLFEDVFYDSALKTHDFSSTSHTNSHVCCWVFVFVSFWIVRTSIYFTHSSCATCKCSHQFINSFYFFSVFFYFFWFAHLNITIYTSTVYVNCH